MQRLMDAEFKKTGHENVAMPVLIPESLLKKEGELVNGFAPEVAWVTMGGSEKLEERLAFRPTSETMFCDHWSRVLQTYRQLPMLYNQWCSVIRWEKTTRPFLRSREFWWQEGHTIHETAEEAQSETMQQLNCYADFFRHVLAIPVVPGRKTEKEKFAGAEATYTVECMMKDRKALQGATSHYFGDKFSRAYDVTFTGRDNKLQYPFQTSWGSTTRMIGAVIMTHGDNNGLVLPPRIAPTQVVIVPIAAHKNPEVLETAKSVMADLIAADVRVKLDDSDQSMGWKCAEYEMRGVPIRLELGPRDLAEGNCCLVRRDNGEKVTAKIEGIVDEIKALLDAIHDNMYTVAEKNLEDKTHLKKMPNDEIDRRVREAAEILDITQFLDRKPKALSGGQRQRVAIGRAIVRSPKVLLMDEPLSNLDAKLRNQMRAEIIKLREKIDTTFIYVTHDQVEAMTLGDRIVICLLYTSPSPRDTR